VAGQWFSAGTPGFSTNNNEIQGEDCDCLAYEFSIYDETIF
jgi:hypothetical protein